jgi:pimeloyl-ACP methyl ester carboxylesterase
MSIDFDAPRTLDAADGTRIHYRVAGPADSVQPALVLLHGLASNQTRFSEFVEFTSLRRVRRVLRLDLRGHGLSIARPPGRLQSWCADLAAMLARENVQRVVIVGHSLGAQVALYFADAYRARVAGLALIDPVFRRALKGNLAWYARFGWAFRAAARAVRVANAIGLGRSDPLPPLDLRELDARAREALKSPEAEAEFVAHYSSTRADLRHIHLAQYLQDLIELFRPLPKLEALTMPVLLLMSSGATFAHAARAARVIARFPNATVQTIDCHHWPLTERPEEVRVAIEGWVTELR